MKDHILKTIFVVLSSVLPISHAAAFDILSQSKETEKLGYGEWHIEIDGELGLIEHFIKPGNLVFDVGGNHGEWSTWALKTEPTIQIVAFEPVPSVFESLRYALQNFSNVQLFNCALSNESGLTNLHYYPQADGLSGFYFREVLRGDQPDPEVIIVQQDTLDDFCNRHAISQIDFIKIDTEGAEWKILNGAKKLLENQQIRAIQFEYGGCYIDAKTKLQDVIKLLTKNRYLIFRIIPTGIVHISHWEDSLENYDLSNYFAICKDDFPGYNLCEGLFESKK